jgi:hypothetical protein
LREAVTAEWVQDLGVESGEALVEHKVEVRSELVLAVELINDLEHDPRAEALDLPNQSLAAKLLYRLI